MKHRFEDYTVRVYWHAGYEYFVAVIPEIRFCTGDGKTPEKAISDLREGFEVMRDVAEVEGKPWPAPRPEYEITPEILERAAEILNFSALARKAGMNNQTLISKIKRGTDFTDKEIRNLSNALLSDGVALGSYGEKQQSAKSGKRKKKAKRP